MSTFPTLSKAVQAIAMDSGVFKNAAIDHMMATLRTKYADHVLDAVDKELAALTEDQFVTVVVGEQGVVPTSTTLDVVLNAAFEAI